jgi:hypothetical protein
MTNNPPGAVAEAKINISRLAQFFMPGLWHFFHRVALGVGEKKKLADVVSRFSVNWYAVAAPLVVARWEVMLHLGALFLAAGAVAGMYFQGLFQGYQAIWSSTFITGESSVIAFVRALWSKSPEYNVRCSVLAGGRINVTRCHRKATKPPCDSSVRYYGVAHNLDPAGCASGMAMEKHRAAAQRYRP